MKKQKIEKKNIFYGVIYSVDDITDAYYYEDRLAKEVTKKTNEVYEIQHSVFASLANMIEARDGITGTHIKNTSAYVKILVNGIIKKKLFKNKITKKYAVIIEKAAPLHDIGKVAIPDYVLKKEGRLTDEEFEIIKTHTIKGAEIIDGTIINLDDDEYFEVVREMAYYHHEKWNGTGYPCGLKGHDIPISARIMAVADVYDALRSKRSYKDGFSKEKARDIIVEGRGSHFDPVLVDVFLDNIDEFEKISDNI